MQETKLKNLTLFLLETLILQRTNRITDWFVYSFNEFIYEYYNTNKELLEPIYNLNILDKFIKENYELLSLEQMIQLIEKFRGFDGYLDLVESVNQETDKKLNNLALLFIEFQQELYKNYFENEQMNYPKGYPRILQ